VFREQQRPNCRQRRQPAISSNAAAGNAAITFDLVMISQQADFEIPSTSTSKQPFTSATIDAPSRDRIEFLPLEATTFSQLAQ
jgi:hypothetical protein